MNLFPGCSPFLAYELAEVVPYRENAHSAHFSDDVPHIYHYIHMIVF